MKVNGELEELLKDHNQVLESIIFIFPKTSVKIGGDTIKDKL
jgi:hypothetical protein